MEHMSFAKGICWIDDCRIPTTDKQQILVNEGNKNIFDNSRKKAITDGKKIIFVEPIGRFPANILISDDILNDGVISKSQDNIRNNKLEQKIYGGGNGLPPQASKGFNDKGSNSRYYDIDKWFDNLLESCG